MSTISENVPKKYKHQHLIIRADVFLIQCADIGKNVVFSIGNRENHCFF